MIGFDPATLFQFKIESKRSKNAFEMDTTCVILNADKSSWL